MNHQDHWNSAVYDELRQMAGAMMVGERDGHTLEATALTHEVWLRLLKSQNAERMEHGAFLGLAAQAMRRILTEHARRACSAKRGGGARKTTLEGKALSNEPEHFALDLDAALGALQALDPELARLVELRFYAGSSTEELADALGLSERSVKRRWRFARAWLQQYMLESES